MAFILIAFRICVCPSNQNLKHLKAEYIISDLEVRLEILPIQTRTHLNAGTLNTALKHAVKCISIFLQMICQSESKPGRMRNQ